MHFGQNYLLTKLILVRYNHHDFPIIRYLNKMCWKIWNELEFWQDKLDYLNSQSHDLNLQHAQKTYFRLIKTPDIKFSYFREHQNFSAIPIAKAKSKTQISVQRSDEGRIFGIFLSSHQPNKILIYLFDRIGKPHNCIEIISQEGFKHLNQKYLLDSIGEVYSIESSFGGGRYFLKNVQNKSGSPVTRIFENSGVGKNGEVFQLGQKLSHFTTIPNAQKILYLGSNTLDMLILGSDSLRKVGFLNKQNICILKKAKDIVRVPNNFGFIVLGSNNKLYILKIHNDDILLSRCQTPKRLGKISKLVESASQTSIINEDCVIYRIVFVSTYDSTKPLFLPEHKFQASNISEIGNSDDYYGIGLGKINSNYLEFSLISKSSMFLDYHIITQDVFGNYLIEYRWFSHRNKKIKSDTIWAYFSNGKIVRSSEYGGYIIPNDSKTLNNLVDSKIVCSYPDGTNLKVITTSNNRKHSTYYVFE